MAKRCVCELAVHGPRAGARGNGALVSGWAAGSPRALGVPAPRTPPQAPFWGAGGSALRKWGSPAMVVVSVYAVPGFSELQVLIPVGQVKTSGFVASPGDK